MIGPLPRASDDVDAAHRVPAVLETKGKQQKSPVLVTRQNQDPISVGWKRITAPYVIVSQRARARSVSGLSRSAGEKNGTLTVFGPERNRTDAYLIAGGQARAEC